MKASTHASGPTAWARLAHLFVDFGTRHGVAREELMRAAHLGDAALTDPDARIPLVWLYDLLEALGRSTNDEQFGLELPLGLEIDTLDVLGFLFITSDTFGNALERTLRYQRLWNEGERLELEVEGEVARLKYEPYGPWRPAHVAMAEATLSDVVVNTPRFVPGLTFERVDFRHHQPHDPARAEQVLGVPVKFDCGTNEALFSASMLNLPIPDANGKLCTFFERYADEKMKQVPGASPSSVAERLRSLIRSQLPDGDLKVQTLAARLHMSGRTLQRRLQEEGTSLHGELDGIRRQQALYFLDRGTAVAELSWLLGYADPSSFHHAFKRWTGISPEAWRAGRRMTGANVA